MLNLCPCLFLDHLHYEKNKSGKILLNQQGFRGENTQELDSQCRASKIQEEGQVCIEKMFFSCNQTEEKQRDSKQEEKTVTPLPSYNKFQKYRTNNVIF